MDKEPLKLTEEVAAKYNLQHIAAGSYDFPGFGILHLQLLTLAQADKLVERKFPYLVLKSTGPAQLALTVLDAPPAENVKASKKTGGTDAAT